MTFQLYGQPAAVLQTDFSPGSGNALQACVAALFHESMDKTPNFVTLASYQDGIRDYVGPFYSVQKMNPPGQAHAGYLCILRGKSPRGDFGHVVVARCRNDGNFDMVWDPHPDSTFLDTKEAFGWYMVFEKKSSE